MSSTGPLSFDGVYRNVFENRDALKGREGIAFVIGNVVGKDNSFDTGQPHETFCTWEELVELGLEIGWHTWTHPDLRALSDSDLESEVTPPYHMRHFAYPYGKFDNRVIDAVKDAGFEYAWTAGGGDDSQYQRRRWHI